MYAPSNNLGEIGPKIISKQTIESKNIDLFEPKFKHIQEDLKYMFLIDVEDEHDLKSHTIKNKMYDVMIRELENGSHYALDYFIEENLLTENDIKEEDIPKLRSDASKILDTLKGPRLISAKNLFIKAGIISQH